VFNFHATHNINQFAAYAQDSVTAGNFAFDIGFRLDYYDGLPDKNRAGTARGHRIQY